MWMPAPHPAATFFTPCELNHPAIRFWTIRGNSSLTQSNLVFGDGDHSGSSRLRRLRKLWAAERSQDFGGFQVATFYATSKRIQMAPRKTSRTAAS